MLAHGYAALAYYHSNRDEIDSDLRVDDAEAERLEQQQPGAQDQGE